MSNFLIKLYPTKLTNELNNAVLNVAESAIKKRNDITYANIVVIWRQLLLGDAPVVRVGPRVPLEVDEFLFLALSLAGVHPQVVGRDVLRTNVEPHRKVPALWSPEERCVKLVTSLI